MTNKNNVKTHCCASHTPQLRFPEFANEEHSNLKKYSFEDIFLFSTGKNIKQREASPEFETPCVRYGELYHMYNEVIYEIVNRTNLDKSELCFGEGNEILLPSAGEDPLDIGSASALTIKNIAIGRTINILKPKIESLYSQIFVSYYINQQLKRKISSLAKGVSISNVYNSDLKKLDITLPVLPEQTKIANFLTAVDKRINLLQKKKSELTQYKKGVMQKLFDIKADGCPALRFKQDDGSDFPDWKEKKLGDIYSFKTTNSFSRDKLNYENGDVKNIHYGDIHTKFNSLFDVTKEYVPFVNSDIDISKIPNDCYLQEGDLVIADASEDYNGIGKTIEIKNLNGEKIIAGLHTFLACRQSGEMANDFASFLMKTYRVRLEIKRIAQGIKVLGISKNRLGEIPLIIPTPPEQQKIANFLSTIDKSIENIANQIEQSQAWKQGLLQKMFV